MIAAMKSEMRKLLTVRTTYFLTGLALLLVVFTAFYASGWRAGTSNLMDPGTLAGDITGAVQTVTIFATLVGILLFTNEYRYNTITYTLTLSNSRSKVLLAKIMVVSIFAIIFTLAVGVLSPLISVLAIHMHHKILVSQQLDYGDLLWRCLFFGWGYAMAGLAIAALLRNQIGSIITFLLVPATVEGLLSLLLKKNAEYLPFNALTAVISKDSISIFGGNITPVHAALVFLGYLVIAWALAWFLFLKRDAN